MYKKITSIFDRYSSNGIALQTLSHYKTYRDTYKFIKKSQWWDSEKILEYQTNKLKELVHHSYNNVPYYKKLFDSIGLKPKDIQSLEDIKKIPFLTKKIIRENIKELKARNYPEHKFELSWTGGSTGFPMHFYCERGTWLAILNAYGKLMLEWIGCSYLDKNVLITGRNKPYRSQLFGRMLVLSSFYMNEEYMTRFIHKIRRLKPKYINSYPSAITILSKFIKKNNLELIPNLEKIICHAETLYEWQRNLVESTFKCKIHQQYGLREQTTLGCTCEHSDYFHIFPENGILELVDKNGNYLSKEGEIGEIVGTGFNTGIFPFIRYKTEDMGIHTNKKCSCGRSYPLIKRIEGRLQDFVISKTGKLVPFTRLHHLVAESSSSVEECQFYQDVEGVIILNIVKSKSYSDYDTKKIESGFDKIFGNKLKIEVKFVDHIPLTDRGKYRFLIQKLPINL